MNINDLIDALAVDVPGCPRATQRDLLRWAQRELCYEGNVWVFSDGPVVVAAQSDSPEVETPPGGEVLRILRLYEQGQALRPGVDYWQPSAGTVAFRRLPSADELEGALVCRPAAGRDLPADLLSRWAEAVLHGARYRLLGMPQPWRDSALSDYHRRLFLDAQAEARHLAGAGHQHGSLRMQVPSFL